MVLRFIERNRKMISNEKDRFYTCFEGCEICKEFPEKLPRETIHIPDNFSGTIVVRRKEPNPICFSYNFENDKLISVSVK